MPVIEPKDQSLKKLKNVHLWHADMSSCSQRVRIALAEKNIPFKSHVINLHMRENASKGYQRIHPKGVVPALVNDGELVIESVDIIDYLDNKFAGISLRPSDASEVQTTKDLMARADQSQANLKLLTFEFLFRAAPPTPLDIMETFFKTHENEWLKQFYRDFMAGFPRSRIEASVNATHDDFSRLEATLSDGRSWLVGNDFTLADIAWMPNFHRFDLIGWPFDRYPALQRWFGRAAARPGYHEGLVKWEPVGFKEIIGPELDARRKAGDGIETYGVLAA